MEKLAPIIVPKASDVLANRLRNMILGGQLTTGDPLPTERELVAETGLSRSSVREALRILEIEGLINTRPGRTGGSVVTLPGRASIVRSMELFVRTHGVRLEALLECRIGLEPFLARLAARNRTQSALQEIRDLHKAFIASVDDVPRYKRVNLEWHLAVARASGNEPLTAFMEAIAEPIMDAAGYQQVTTDEIRRKTVRAHERILRAIEAQDEDAAFAAMERHVSAYGKIVREAMRAGTIK
ncbi:FadR/GntR family transcriptional regulator [Rhodoligotrophos defluvii]|uniref:FadR/GntR family transcriptional regulator n=1 Tax=Rhodoligotrophos defluvii TaxID=2561934 RepID=UPI0010C9E16B|nr:FadR/GntR family transcriptional regulator [Rhodoligotrophos defluvii]